MEHKKVILAKIAQLFNEKSITWGLGASMMLYFRKVVTTFHDIDIMVDTKDIQSALALLSPLGTHVKRVPNAQYQTEYFYEFVIEGVDIDVMAGFKIVKDAQVHDCPFTKENIDGHILLHHQCVYLQSLSDWKRYYALMGRQEKVQLIDTFEHAHLL